jgi:hypothetical protein
MSLTPFSRNAMRELKANKDEEAHIMMINLLVKQFYQETVRFAERNKQTFYKININNNNSYYSIKLPSNSNSSYPHDLGIPREYATEHMEEILTHLRNLFPDCVVEYKKVSMARGRDGKEYDISALDDKMRPFIDVRQARTEEHIVIDWS